MADFHPELQAKLDDLQRELEVSSILHRVRSLDMFPTPVLTGLKVQSCHLYGMH